MNYFNAIVITDYQAKISYHQISNPKCFVDNILKCLSVDRIFFYCLPRREAKKGTYCGYWNHAKGLQLTVKSNA